MKNWKSDIHKFVGKAFDASYNQQIANNPVLSLFSKENIQSPFYELRETGGYSIMGEYDGKNLTAADESRGFITIVEPREYSLYVDMPLKQVKLDAMGESRKTGAKLSRSAMLTRLKLALEIFSNAYKSDVLGGDGKPWASDSHPIASKGDIKAADSANRKAVADMSKGTYSNLLTKELSVEAIGEAQKLGAKIVAPNGAPTGLMYDLVLISPELEPLAKKLFGVNSKQPTLNPDGTANNQANPLSDIKYMVAGSGSWGLQGKQWALCDSTAIKEVLKEIVITEPMVKQTELDNPLINRELIYMDLGFAFGDARPIIFSTGATK